MSIPVELVVAVGENEVIGAGGAMPWHLSTDLKRFRALTMGRPMIMGRKTFDSIGKPLPGRTSIVVTRDRSWHHAGVEVCHDAITALGKARQIARQQAASAVAVIGGGEIYRMLLDHADRVHLTRVHATPQGDTTFASPSAPQWRRVSSELVPAGPKDSSDTTYEVWERVVSRP